MVTTGKAADGELARDQIHDGGDDLEALRERVHELELELEDRKLIDRAKGLLMDWGMSEADAYARMRRASMDSRRPLRDIAEAVCLSGLVFRQAEGES